MQGCYQNSIIIWKSRKSSLFITLLSTYRPEITRELLDDQQPVNSLDLVVRVFYLKFSELMQDMKAHAFGSYASHFDFVDNQKQGLLHTHILLFLGDGKSKYTKPEIIDEVFCAKFPDSNISP